MSSLSKTKKSRLLVAIEAAFQALFLSVSIVDVRIRFIDDFVSHAGL
jgi:hypothetical protein